MVGKCYNDLRCCDNPSLVLFALAFFMNLLFDNGQFSRSLGLCKDYMYTMRCFLLAGTSIWNPRYMGSIF